MIYKNTRNVPARFEAAGRTVLISPLASVEISEDVSVPAWISKGHSPKPKKKKDSKNYFKKPVAPTEPKVKQESVITSNPDTN